MAMRSTSSFSKRTTCSGRYGAAHGDSTEQMPVDVWPQFCGSDLPWSLCQAKVLTHSLPWAQSAFVAQGALQSSDQLVIHRVEPSVRFAHIQVVPQTAPQVVHVPLAQVGVGEIPH